MNKSARTIVSLRESLRQTTASFIGVLPILVGVLLLTSLLLQVVPMNRVIGWFGQNAFTDAVIGSAVGSIAAGNPAASYVFAGELLAAGVSLAAATGLIVSWVTVGMVQLPAEALMLGWRFALLRNGICFVLSIAVALLTVSVVGALA